MTQSEAPKLRLRIQFGKDAMIGPGKADLLARIAETGSIAAAGRMMGMSYKRAWMLVETMNAIFAAPVVISTRGGSAGGGALLTETGEAVLARYRLIEARAAEACQPDIAALLALVRPDFSQE